VPMGPRSGVWAVDVDTNQDHTADGIAAWQALLAEHGDINSRTHITASDGLHVLLIYPEDEHIGCSRGSIPNGGAYQPRWRTAGWPDSFLPPDFSVFANRPSVFRWQ
jgi:hypothetical protein